VRNKIIILTFTLLFIPLCLYAWDGKVVGVTDGDTIKVLRYGKQVRIRLAAIDCPEKGQPWGNKAKQFTSHMALFQTVGVLPVGKDRYGRIIGWVFIEEINLNKALLRAGLAWHYRQYSNDSLLTALEMEARAAKKGLWSEPDPVAPWVWRNIDQKM
jgi:endonuclease YncB( thermonuclease family)